MTGYVEMMLERNQDFRTFAWSCARNFGALLHMRDEPMDAPITYPEHDDFHMQACDNAQAELERLLALPEAQREPEGERRRQAAISDFEQYAVKQLGRVGRCREMRSQVDAWTPPSSEHDGLKAFMLEQLDISCGGVEFYCQERRAQLHQKSARESYESAVEAARQQVQRQAALHENERRRVAEKRCWLDQLKESIGAW